MNGKHRIVPPRIALLTMLAMVYQLACGGKTGTALTSPAEASSAGTGPAADAGPCPVLSSQYDQSCSRDSDCLAVNETVSCPATTCAFCETGVINKQAEGSYMKAFSAATAGVDLDAGRCNCPNSGEPCCRMGLCQHCD
jgi:hypothetical protein